MSLNQQGIKGPYGGYRDDLPAIHTPDESWADVVNFICRRGRTHSRMNLIYYGQPSSPTPDKAIVRSYRTFKDAAGYLHTLALTTKSAYFVTNNGAGPVYNVLALPSLSSLSGTSLPYGIFTTQNRVFFSNGSVPVLYSDGESSLKQANAPGACRFLTVNASTLIGAYWTEPAPGAVGSTNLPQRVRWAQSGNPTIWNGFTSGFEDLLDVPDDIAGLQTVGLNTLIFRTNGLSIMYATSNGAAPFGFEHVSTDDIGSGAFFPYTIARFRDRAFYVSDYDVHMIDSGLRISDIGGKARTRMFIQLGQASGDIVTGWTIGAIAPGIPFPSYWLSIPGQAVWVYSINDDTWQQFSSVAGYPTWVGQALFP